MAWASVRSAWRRCRSLKLGYAWVISDGPVLKMLKWYERCGCERVALPIQNITDHSWGAKHAFVMMSTPNAVAWLVPAVVLPKVEQWLPINYWKTSVHRALVFSRPWKTWGEGCTIHNALCRRWLRSGDGQIRSYCKPVVRHDDSITLNRGSRSSSFQSKVFDKKKTVHDSQPDIPRNGAIEASAYYAFCHEGQPDTA